MTKLKVVFRTDPTGFSKDITEEVFIPSEVCLFCCHDSRLKISRLYDEVKKALEYKGYDLSSEYAHFELLKVYVA